MHPTAVRLVRIIPRAQLPAAVKDTAFVAPALTHHPKRVTLINRLQQRKAELGDEWPANIRLEPEMRKQAFKGLTDGARDQLKKMMKET